MSAHDHPHDHPHAPQPGPEPEPLDPLSFGPDQRCFGCGPNHPQGLRMRFVREGDEVVTRFVPRDGWEGPPGIFHGGLQTTLADELAAWTLIGLRGRMGFTAAIDVRLLRPARIDRELVGRGKILSEKNNVAVVSTLFAQDGKTTLRGRVTYVLPTEAEAEKILQAPLPEPWRRFARRG
ncbi:PaaI family thioesterase [Myxococcota bacterium]|nr:PaaI family thioesterase [Myxococcota bacterium]